MSGSQHHRVAGVRTTGRVPSRRGDVGLAPDVACRSSSDATSAATTRPISNVATPTPSSLGKAADHQDTSAEAAPTTGRRPAQCGPRRPCSTPVTTRYAATGTATASPAVVAVVDEGEPCEAAAASCSPAPSAPRDPRTT